MNNKVNGYHYEVVKVHKMLSGPRASSNAPDRVISYFLSFLFGIMKRCVGIYLPD